MLIRPITPSSSAICSVVARISSSISSPRLSGGITQAESPEWTPASSTCCMIPATQTSSPSPSASTSTSIAFSRKRSSSSGCSWSALTCGLEVGGQVLGRVTDLHRPAAEHVGGPDQQREADLFGDHLRLLGRERGAVGRVLDAEPAQQGAEPAAVLGQVDRVDRGAEQRHARLFEGAGELQRRLAAELDDHALRALLGADGEHVLGGQRLEVEAVGGVVVGGDGLRVAVDHHRVAAQLAGGHRRVHAAVVELDPLADPVRAGAEDDDRVALAAADLGGRRRAVGAGALVGGVVVGRRRLELGGAGVDRLVGADQPLGAVALAGQRLQLAQEPAVDQAGLVHRLDAEAAAERLEDQVEALGAGLLEGDQQVRVGLRAPPGSASSSRERIALAKDSRKVRPIAIASPTLCM